LYASNSTINEALATDQSGDEIAESRLADVLVYRHLSHQQHQSCCSTMQQLSRRTARLSSRTIYPVSLQMSRKAPPARHLSNDASQSDPVAKTAPPNLEHSTTSKIDVESLLSKPSWSISSLLPPQSADKSQAKSPITSEKLHHLLRLSALEPPKTAEEEQSMLRTLSDQLHFVRAVQAVDTEGVEPLRSLRDETKEAQMELEEETMARYRDAIEKEEVVGKHYKRVRRRKIVLHEKDSETMEDWKPVDMAERKFGKYFVVEKGKTET